jgi:formate hydrogenlyase subunit 4
MNFEGILAQFAAGALALALAPLLVGWVNQCRAWLQNRSAPPLLQPFRTLHKLFWKESIIAHGATPMYRISPYVVFSCMLLASMIIPTLSTNLPLAPRPTRSRWWGSSRSRACSSRSRPWISAPRSARWAPDARC